MRLSGGAPVDITSEGGALTDMGDGVWAAELGIVPRRVPRRKREKTQMQLACDERSTDVSEVFEFDDAYDLPTDVSETRPFD